MKRFLLVALMLLSPSLLNAQSGAGILERTYRISPVPSDANRQRLELKIIVADDANHSLTSSKTLSADDTDVWESGGLGRTSLLMRLYAESLGDLEQAVAARLEVVRSETVDPSRVMNYVSYANLLAYRRNTLP